jgi:hypothetical protein
MKPPKTLIRIGLVLLIVVATILVVRAVLNFAEGRALARELAELKVKGVAVTARDLAPPCPDEDNAARLWKAAENLLTTEEGEGRLTIAGAFGKYAGGMPIEPARKADLRRLAVENERVLKLMAEAGAKPCFLLRDPSASLVDSIIPSALKMVHATQLLGFSALFMAEDGDVAGAIERIRSGLKFTPMVAGEGNMMVYLIAVADTRMLVHFLGGICRDREVGDDTLQRLIGDLDPAPWRDRTAAGIRGERVLFIELGQLSLRSETKDLQWLFGEPSIVKDLGIWLIRPLLKRDVRRTLPKYVDLEAQALRPYYESRDFLRAQGAESKDRPWYAFLSKSVWGNLESTFLKEAQLEAMILASRTGLACRLYKSRTGAYPETLNALVPDVLKEVPIDPFTGKPFVYRREGEGFIVYSLGSNEKDDGGRSTYMITQLVMDKDDDWAWKEDR